jgi:hypothetical protein
MHGLKKTIILMGISALLAACGGGGEESQSINTSGVTPNTATDTVISGMATKGPVTGTASFYTLDANGSKGSLLKNSAVVFGRYSANIGKYAGPVIIEVSGSYTDEATGKSMTLAAPLRAALADATGTIKVAVTPLTELAVQKAGTLTASGIDSGNKLVSDIFKVNIISTQPVAPTRDAVTVASQSQKDYTLALAAISQLSQTRGEPLAATLKSVARDISTSGMASQTVSSFQQAVTTFITSGNNLTGVGDVTATNLAKINGSSTTSYTLSIQGSFAVNAIKGIQFEIVIPPGLTVRSDVASGATVPGIVTAASGVPDILSRYSASDGVLHLGMISSKGIGVGDFATIVFDIVPGYVKPSPAAFSISNPTAVDGTATKIDGVSITVK